MASSDYHFVTHWRMRGTVEEVVRVLVDGLNLPRWWPSVYLHMQEVEPGDEHGMGKVVSLYTKGWLPYTLRWHLRITDIHRDGFAFDASGDFTGRGTWFYRQDGPWVDIIYDWKIRADKPLLRYLSPIMKPIFAANHHWAMAKGEESLRLELKRRRAATDEERARIPAPPPPTTTSPLPLLAGGVMLAGVVYMLARRRPGRRD